MGRIRPGALPEGALLGRYADVPGAYTDCYTTQVAGQVDLARYVESFYTTWLFRLERIVLQFLVGRPSDDAQARALAAGELDAFAAWSVEDRTASELLMCDMHGRTRSWFRVEAAAEGGSRLYFGSAVLPRAPADGGAAGIRGVYRWLLPAHRLYSRALLRAASSILS